ncbi:MAG: C4-type zinc ribbon domain-containing protein [Desulfobacterales bacterium]|nr:C4-type zinc ribbon domain-containing protein [Desulfobacterales bacterium]
MTNDKWLMTNMKEQIDILVKLQKIETESDDIKLKLSGVSEKLDFFDSSLKELEQSIADKKSLLNDLNKKYRSYDSEVQTNFALIKKSQGRLVGVKTNREYQALLKEIEELKIKNSQAEDEMLLCLDRIDETEKDISVEKGEYSKLKEKVSSDKETIMREVDYGKERLAALKDEWDSTSSKVKPELFKRYTMVGQRVKGTAIVSVKKSVCNGCNMNLPPQMYNELQRCDSLKFCPNCQRIIYWEQL